jgi:hypothetical protein
VVFDGGEAHSATPCDSATTVIDLTQPGKFSVSGDGDDRYARLLSEKFGLRQTDA